ncbi:MAG: GNAT family N-acetyltransferase [Acidimicrobiales bacterium]
MIDIRPATADEMGQLGTLTGYSYGGSFGDGPETKTATANQPEWTLCAFDDGLLVSSFVTIPFTARMNGRPMAFGGVSGVATRPDYRRRGLVRRLMTDATATMRDQGQPIAGLWASQAAIYQRYGYSISSYRRSYRIDSADIVFHDGDSGNGDVRWLDAESAFDEVRALYISFVADRIGYLHRSRALWSFGVMDAPDEDGPVSVGLSHDSNGKPNGYVVYTLRADRVDNPARAQELRIRDLVWLDLDAYRSLWSFVASHDLVGRVTWPDAPVDDPAEELLAEPRMLNIRDEEGTWVRIVDVAPALAGRGYLSAGHGSIEVFGDDLAPWNNGKYSIETDGGEASVERLGSSDTVDATLSVKALGSLFTGMRSVQRLRSWGLIDADDDAMDRLGSLFATRFAPHTPDHY